MWELNWHTYKPKCAHWMVRKSLQVLISQHIVVGTRIISDQWWAYSNFGNLRNGFCMHSLGWQDYSSLETWNMVFICILYDFVHESRSWSPRRCCTHTHNVDNMQVFAKRKLKITFGTSRDLFQTYLQECVWQSTFWHDQIFANTHLYFRDVHFN